MPEEGGDTRANVSENPEMDESLRRTSADSAAERSLILALEAQIEAQRVEIRLRDDALRRASERQQALARSYAALFDAAPVAVIEVTGVGAVGRCNSGARMLLPGLEPGALLTEAGLDESTLR